MKGLAKLDAVVSECLWHGHPSLKVIHGHGSGGGVSRVKPHVLAALRKHAERLGAVMEQNGDNPGASAEAEVISALIKLSAGGP